MNPKDMYKKTSTPAVLPLCIAYKMTPLSYDIRHLIPCNNPIQPLKRKTQPLDTTALFIVNMDERTLKTERR